MTYPHDETTLIPLCHSCQHIYTAKASLPCADCNALPLKVPTFRVYHAECPIGSQRREVHHERLTATGI